MCMLTFVPKGVTPDREALLNGASWNTDGHGWAIVGKDRIHSGRGFDADRVASEFIAARKRHNGPALFHSRWATHGAVVTENCHPFKVGRDRKTVLAHNGILPKIAQPIKGDARSDTRKFAQDIMPKLFGELDNAEVRGSLSTWLGGNKIVVLTANRAYARRSYIFGEALGHWDSRIWYSNSDYRSALPAFTGKGASWRAGSWNGRWDSPDARCEVCDGVLAGWDEHCLRCESCIFCLTHKDECLCAVASMTSADQLH